MKTTSNKRLILSLVIAVFVALSGIVYFSYSTVIKEGYVTTEISRDKYLYTFLFDRKAEFYRDKDFPEAARGMTLDYKTVIYLDVGKAEENKTCVREKTPEAFTVQTRYGLFLVCTLLDKTIAVMTFQVKNQWHDINVLVPANKSLDEKYEGKLDQMTLQTIFESIEVKSIR